MTITTNTKNTTLRSDLVGLIDVADNGKVAYLDRCLKVAERMLGMLADQVQAEIAAAKAQRTNSPISSKTLQNDLISARHLVIKYGGYVEAGDAINLRNSAAKRAAYSPQVLQQELAPTDSIKPAKKVATKHVVVKVDPEATIADVDRAIKELQALKASLKK